MVAVHQVDGAAALTAFVPLNRFNRFQLTEMLARVRYEEVAAGRLLFNRGDSLKEAVYIVSGEVVIAPPGRPVSIVAAGDQAARYPLVCSEVCTVAAYAKTSVRLLKLPRSDLLLYAGTRVQESLEIATLEALGHGQWVSRWLDSPLLARLPAAEVQALVARMTEVTVRADEVVLQQDDSADCYYVIKQGRCAVLRKPAAHAPEIQLAVLGEGQGFGEEALITDATRNATVRMLEDGVLMRLDKANFIEHFTKPLLRYIDWEGAEALQQQSAALIDVRSPEEFETSGLVGSLNIPMPLLRLKAARLNRQGRYVLLSGAGQTSAAAAFLLMQQGLEVWVLKEGLDAVPLHRRRGNTAPAAATDGPVVSFCIQPQKGEQSAPAAPAHPIEWVSDQVLWQTTIGYREDPKIEALVTPPTALAMEPVAASEPSPAPQKKDFTCAEQGSKLEIVSPARARQWRSWWVAGLVAVSVAAGYGLAATGWQDRLKELVPGFAALTSDAPLSSATPDGGPHADRAEESGRIAR